MLITSASADAGKPLDRMLLKHVGESIKALKGHRQHLCRIGRSTEVVDARIDTLRQVVAQVEILQRLPVK